MDSSSPDGTVSLEDLVRETAVAGPPVEESVGAIDKLLEIEDPSFAAELTELRAQGGPASGDVTVAVDSDIDSILAQEKSEKAARGFRKIRLWLVVVPPRKITRTVSNLKALKPWLILTVLPAVKDGAGSSLTGLKSSAKYALAKVKVGLNWFSKLSPPSKLLLVTVIVFAGASVAMVRVALNGSFLPSLQRDFLYSFADVADQSFAIGKDEGWEDLNDPLLHPEHIVLIERLIVNLRAPGDGTDPMALVDLYIEAGSQEAAVELKDREAATRDMILRTMEQTTFEDLSTDAGKNKLKVFLRKNLNDMLSRGRVRRVFYKSIVLKP